MAVKIALAGNPNAGKTTLFNSLTGSNQFVGNWPGVTVEKKEGKLKNREDVTVVDLPGIYSLSPYTPEEIVARNFLLYEKPDVILDIVDGTNLERNLYLTTQLTETGIPVVIAINMMDVVKKNGDVIDTEILSRKMNCKVVEISALKEDGVLAAADIAIEEAKKGRVIPKHIFSGTVEHAIAHIEEAVIHEMDEKEQRWYAIKLFERDERVLEKLKVSKETLSHIENDISFVEKLMDDDSQAVIINERYDYITKVTEECYKRKHKGISPSDVIDAVVTSKYLGLPVFALIMFFVYWVSMAGVGAKATEFMQNGVFGDGFFLFGISSSDYADAKYEYDNATLLIDGYNEYKKNETDEPTLFTYKITDEKTGETYIKAATAEEKEKAEAVIEKYGNGPKKEDFGIYVKGIPVLTEKLLDEIGTNEVLKGVILQGILVGVGSVLGFLPQMFILFFMLAFLEGCGYMSRIAFILDRVFKKIGLSGKSFIPILIGTGCGVPGIMASRTIENDKNRRMTVMTTTFIPCSAKVPAIALISGAVFSGSALVATSAYLCGMAAIIISGIILKKTKLFSSEDTPFVMELPSYHLPTFKNVLRSMWERGWEFIRKAGTVILISSVIVWFTTYFGFVDGGFSFLNAEQFDKSLLATVGKYIAPLFSPLGFGKWQMAVATVTGIFAKENIVGTLSVLYGGSGNVFESIKVVFTGVTAYSFLIFNLLCAPCIAAISAIRREMKSVGWTLFAVLYQTVFAYLVCLMINQFGNLFSGNISSLLDKISLSVAFLTLAFAVFLIFRKNKNKSGRLGERK